MACHDSWNQFACLRIGSTSGKQQVALVVLFSCYNFISANNANQRDKTDLWLCTTEIKPILGCDMHEVRAAIYKGSSRRLDIHKFNYLSNTSMMLEATQYSAKYIILWICARKGPRIWASSFESVNLLPVCHHSLLRQERYERTTELTRYTGFWHTTEPIWWNDIWCIKWSD